jgi:hypothetical protein
MMNDVVLSCVVARKSSVTNVEEKERRRERKVNKADIFPYPLACQSVGYMVAKEQSREHHGDRGRLASLRVIPHEKASQQSQNVGQAEFYDRSKFQPRPGP